MKWLDNFLVWLVADDPLPDYVQRKMKEDIQLQQAGLRFYGFNPGALDGIDGPKTAAAKAAWRASKVSPGTHSVKASSFADPEDVRRFRVCKASGKSDQECFRVGDNGVGCWGDDTTVDRPMCALPREDWEPLGNQAARGKKVIVSANGLTIVCELRDTMPRRANIENGAGIDLNPAACKALGLRPPIMLPATWRWA